MPTTMCARCSLHTGPDEASGSKARYLSSLWRSTRWQRVHGFRSSQQLCPESGIHSHAVSTTAASSTVPSMSPSSNSPAVGTASCECRYNYFYSGGGREDYLPRRRSPEHSNDPLSAAPIRRGPGYPSTPPKKTHLNYVTFLAPDHPRNGPTYKSTRHPARTLLRVPVRRHDARRIGAHMDRGSNLVCEFRLLEQLAESTPVSANHARWAGSIRTSTLWPARRRAIAAESPPMPAPTISTVRGPLGGGSDGGCMVLAGFFLFFPLFFEKASTDGGALGRDWEVRGSAVEKMIFQLHYVQYL